MAVVILSLFFTFACKIPKPNRTTPQAPAATARSSHPHPLSEHFAKFPQVTTSHDHASFYVESSGIPEHEMMTGITSWQQQVALPQNYEGNNAWQFPLKPELSDNPISSKDNLMRGAIAIAVNGIPIFNALNNRGEDAYLAGELDQWGGHAGRADDYHYHIAPLHLQETAGVGQPIAFALDGFPIYGLTEPDGSAVVGLDEYNGHLGADGTYHYHATESYPYINGGLRGKVTVRGSGPENQVEPQPRTIPARPALRPLRGAVITSFKKTGENRYSLGYRVHEGVENFVNYHFTESGEITFEFIDNEAGTTTTESYIRLREDERRGPRGHPAPRRN